MLIVNAKKASQRGASFIEVVIALVIVSLLMAIGAEGFLLWIQNSQIRTVTESIKDGISFARSEAIKRNEPVEIDFDPDYKGWTIVLTSNQAVLRTEAGLADFSSIIVTPDIASTTVTFSSLGRVLQINGDNSVPFGQLNIDNSKMDSDDSINLQLRISASGSVRMCDPNKAAPNPTAC